MPEAENTESPHDQASEIHGRWRDSMLRAMAVGAVAATPVGKALYRHRRVRAGYMEEKNRDEYVRSVFDRHWTACGCPKTGAVLELGPGGNVSTARLFAQQGCEPVVCMDTIPYVDRAALGDIQYRSPEAIEETSLPDESFDVIYSHATLEHVFDPGIAIRNIARLLKQGGRTSHWVDLRDHRDFTSPHAFLRYPDWMWRLAGRARAWPNRWRASDWDRGFEEAGLTTSVTTTNEAPLPTGLRLARRFAAKSASDLQKVGIMIVAQKPVATERPERTQPLTGP